MLKLTVEPCQGHSDCLYVMVARPFWCDCEVMDYLPNIYDGEDEDEEAESLHHGNCFISIPRCSNRTSLLSRIQSIHPSIHPSNQLIAFEQSKQFRTYQDSAGT